MCDQSLSVCVCSLTQLCSTLCNSRDYGLPVLCLWNFSDKNSGMGCHFFLQESSWPREQTCFSYVSYIAGRFFTTEPSGTLPINGSKAKAKILVLLWKIMWILPTPCTNWTCKWLFVVIYIPAYLLIYGSTEYKSDLIGVPCHWGTHDLVKHL